ncbi:TM2 domain-containing protein [Bifidobacterium canis]|uniref:TM2 domain-containing protein n=1 Tax=Bifidobacterium canis TaxID=2610880 RepID=A0A7K1J5C2_9BIFI|nr:TM2 domain-containing protein [Bifidobacterium canis]MUH59858.1 TM2 domain-containing protein [Bifidobacterium canis]
MSDPNAYQPQQPQYGNANGATQPNAAATPENTVNVAPEQQYDANNAQMPQADAYANPYANTENQYAAQNNTMYANTPAQGGYTQYAPQYQQVPSTYIPRNKYVAAALALFFGIFGLHNFYLGFTSKAIAQVLITCLTFGIGAIAVLIWSIVEAIQILTADYGTEHHRDARGVELAD